MKILTIIIPVFNEQNTIEEVLNRVRKVKTPGWKKQIIVVDDCSTDSTPKILKKIQKNQSFILISHKKNLGKGGAIKSALTLVTPSHTRLNAVLTQDADLEYDPNDYSTLLKAFHPTKHPIVYGSRNLGTTNRGYFFAYYCGRVLTNIHNFLYGSKITDLNTGYKLFRTDILKSCNLQVDGFDFCHEVTAKVLKMGHKIKEVAINYYPRTYKEGKKVAVKDAWLDLWTTLKYRFVE
ncbi:MAG: glycosyltransferase family 2 protein [Patescibacteria group bacterium]